MPNKAPRGVGALVHHLVVGQVLGDDWGNTVGQGLSGPGGVEDTWGVSSFGF